MSPFGSASSRLIAQPRASRRQVLGLAAAATVGVAASSAAALPAVGDTGSLPVVVLGQPQVVIVPPPGLDYIAVDPVTVEAELGVVSPPMRVVEDAGAAGGAYVATPVGVNNAGSVTVSLTVTVSAKYRVAALVWTENGQTDSVFVSVDGGAEQTWHLGADHGHWRWAALTDSLDLAAGHHSVTIRGREGGARIDQIRLAGASSDTQTAHAITTLVDHIRKATGVTLPVVTPGGLGDGDLPAGRMFIGWLGPDGSPDDHAGLQDLDGDGFIIEVDPARAQVVILGPTEWGTRFGVYELLERWLGVAWLMPGDHGTHVPSLTSFSLPAASLRQEPTFLSRTLPYLFETNEPNARDWATADPQVLWATRQRTHSRITRTGNHNLFNIFPTSVYADPAKPSYRPEVYPVIGGVPTVPKLGDTTSWQPRFDIQATVDIAASYIIEFFSASPEEPLISLGVNDGHGYSDGDIEEGSVNSDGLASASTAYYRWVNAVVESVLAQRPNLSDKIFPVLAYHEVADPPDFALHPNVVPMITKESHQWADPESRQGFQALFDRWQHHATSLALYDYASGVRFLTPRLYNKDLQAAYRYARDRKLRYSYCDMSPAPIGEGPKTWVYTKLLWDLDADVETLTRRWCELAVGKRAAATLRRYYAMWVEFWETTAQRTAFWEYGRNRTYLPFILCDYLAEVSDDDARAARLLLERTIERTETPDQRARAELIMDTFRYYEAGYLSYPRSVAAPKNAAQAKKLASATIAELPNRTSHAAERLLIEARQEADPVLRHRLDHRRYQHTWTGYSGSAFWHLVDAVRGDTDGPVARELVRAAAGPAGESGTRFARLALEVARGARTQLAPNGSFDDCLGSDVAGWRLIGPIRRIESGGFDGGPALELSPDPAVGITSQEQSIVQAIPITAGLCAFRTRFRATSPQVLEGQVSVKAQLWTASGSNIYAFAQPMQLLRPSGTGWTWVGLCEDIPATALGTPVVQLRLVASLLGFRGEGSVILDDVEVYQEGR